MPDDGSCWKYQAPALLKAGYRVIVPDTLGYGGTDRPVEDEHYKVEKIIDHMFEIIDTLGLKAVYWTHWTQSLIAGTVAPHAALRSDIHQRGP